MYLLYKKPVETCLACLNRLKLELNLPESLTYAGRLDPLASGLILALNSASEADSGGDNEGKPLGQGQHHIQARKQRILDLPKTYELDVVFGVSTDTFDQLGVIYPSEESINWHTLNFDKDKLNSTAVALLKDNIARDFNTPSEISENINLFFKNLIDKNGGKFDMYYPFFSSKTVGGKQLFQISKDLGIAETNLILPKRVVELYSVECMKLESISVKDLVNECIGIAQKVKGYFRQDEIIMKWKEFGENYVSKFTDRDIAISGDELQLKILKLKISCGSGFYMRIIAAWLGQIIGTGAIARNIFRTSIGEYRVEEALNIAEIEK